MATFIVGALVFGLVAAAVWKIVEDRRLEHRLSLDYFSFTEDGTTPLKLEVLPALMQLHRTAKMVGNYDNSRVYLYTEKVVGNVFAKTVTRRKAIPFEITAEEDPFFGEANRKRLLRAAADLEAGRNWHEHDLMEVD